MSGCAVMQHVGGPRMSNARHATAARISASSRCSRRSLHRWRRHRAPLEGRLAHVADGSAEVVIADQFLKKLAIDCMPFANEDLICLRIAHHFCTPGQTVRARQDLISDPCVVKSAQVDASNRGIEADIRARVVRTMLGVGHTRRGWSVSLNVVTDKIAGYQWPA